MSDNDIKKIFNNSIGQIHISKINNLSDDEINYLKNRYNDSLSLKETIFRIINNIDVHPNCPECGNPCKVKYRKLKPFYSTCGNKECIYKRKGNGPKEACLQKYGKENIFQTNFVKEKIKETCLKKYGVDSHTKSNEWKNKQINNLKEKYGVINQFQRENVKEKIKETCLKKYGVEHYNKSKHFKQKMSIIASSEDFQNKRNTTLKNNNTWSSSKDEEYIYNELIKYFSNIYRQYKSELYPFNCDFYIPEIDTYIEYQGSDLHNFKPYDCNNINHQNEIIQLKEKSEKRKQITKKNKTRYDLRIETWSIRDVKKRNIAKENNLNYIELWNIEDFNKWILQYDQLVKK